MNTKNKKIYVYATAACLLAFASMTYYCLFSSFSKKDTTSFIYIDNDDNIDSVYHKLDTVATGHGLSCFRTMVRHSQSWRRNTQGFPSFQERNARTSKPHHTKCSHKGTPCIRNKQANDDGFYHNSKSTQRRECVQEIRLRHNNNSVHVHS